MSSKSICLTSLCEPFINILFGKWDVRLVAGFGFGSNCSHLFTAEGHLVTNRKRKGETNLMCSSRSSAPCCRVKAIHARWTSPPFCRGLLTSCRSKKVTKCYCEWGKAVELKKEHFSFDFFLIKFFKNRKIHKKRTLIAVCFRHHCKEWNLWCETGLEAVVPQ